MTARIITLLVLTAALCPAPPIIRVPGGGGSSAPDNTLILRLKMDEGTGLSIDDETANSNDFTGVGMTWNGSGVSTGSGDAVDFDGSADYADSDSTVNYGGVSIITVCFWMNADASGGTEILCESGSAFWGASNTGSFAIYLDSNNIAGGMHGAEETTSAVRTETAAFTSTAAEHVAIVFDQTANSGSGDVKIYLDGVLQSETVETDAKVSTSTFATQTLYLGARSAASLWYGGLMDDFRIYAGELDSSEVAYVRDNPDE